MISVGAVLAAGQSTRFGDADKLLAPIHGQPMAQYAADALRVLDLDARVVAYRNAHVLPLFDGFETCHVAAQQSDSLRAVVRHAQGLNADRLLVVLADMPGVQVADLRALLVPSDHIVAFHDGRRAQVPACFPAHVFAQLLALRGDKGARDLLRGPDVIFRNVSPEDVMDIDTQEACLRYNR